MVVALIALCSSLTGVAVGASLITGSDVKNGSIGTKDLANGGVTKKDLKKNSVRTKKVKDGSLLAADFSPGEFPGTGPTGLQGPKGDQGDDGAPGAPGSAKAWGMVLSGGTLARGTNATSRLADFSTGVYCIKPSPAVVPNVDAAVLVATVDFSDAENTDHAQWRSDGIGCEDDEMTVRTTADADNDGTYTLVNAGFSFVIP
jgi:hypothetical protein